MTTHQPSRLPSIINLIDQLHDNKSTWLRHTHLNYSPKTLRRPRSSEPNGWVHFREPCAVLAMKSASASAGSQSASSKQQPRRLQQARIRSLSSRWNSPTSASPFTSTTTPDDSAAGSRSSLNLLSSEAHRLMHDVNDDMVDMWASLTSASQNIAVKSTPSSFGQVSNCSELTFGHYGGYNCANCSNQASGLQDPSRSDPEGALPHK
jgi:hypothetical protein